MAELSEIRTAQARNAHDRGREEDPARVAAAVRELGFDPTRNVNVARGLKTLVGFGARRYAVIDAGTNSIKFHIGELGGGRRLADGRRPAEVTRLGEGLEATGEIGAEPIERTSSDQRDGRRGRAATVEAIAAVGTGGTPHRSQPGRGRRRGAGAVRASRSRSSPARTRRRLAYLAVAAGLGLGDGTIVVFDTGGGSSQFTFGHGTEIEERFSLNVGAVRFTEQFGLTNAVSADVVDDALRAIAASSARLDGRPRRPTCRRRWAAR